MQSLAHDTRHPGCVTGRKESEFGRGEMGAHDFPERQALISAKLKSGVKWSPYVRGAMTCEVSKSVVAESINDRGGCRSF